MRVCCLDLEGVLIPEIWIQVARRFGVKDLKLTTRDISDYDQLMQHRIRVLKREGLKLKDIQRAIDTMKSLPGAKAFVKKLQSRYPVILLSDTFYEFAGPLMKQLDYPTLFCNWIRTDRQGFISGYSLRQKDGKRKAVCRLKQMGFEVFASGDSFNDLTMLKEAKKGILFNPPDSIRKTHRRFKVAKNYEQLFKFFTY